MTIRLHHLASAVVWCGVGVAVCVGGCAAEAADQIGSQSEKAEPRSEKAEPKSEKAEPRLERCLVSLVEEAKVPAREAGVLIEMSIREGDSVSKNEVIARIDDSQPQAEKRKAKADHDQTLAKAESDVDVRYAVAAEQVAEAEWAKAMEADKKVPGSVTQVERARLKLNETKSELQIEQATLERKISALTAQSKEVEVQAAENAIERRRITSPLDGVVVQVFPHQGE